jgi:hypothetical protein
MVREWKRAKGETKRMGMETEDEIMFSVSRRIKQIFSKI